VQLFANKQMAALFLCNRKVCSTRLFGDRYC